jgi:1-acyl-sn-glycerol-3-phosphate acyltransferase
MMWPYLASRKILRALLGALFRIEVRGSGRCPAAGPVVVVSNHATYLDPMFLGMSLERPIRFMAWAVLFKVPGVALFSRVMKSFPVDLEGGRYADAIKQARAVLDQGEVLGVFPEGGRSADGIIRNMHPGGVRLAMRAGAAILPVSIAGGPAVWPMGRLLFRASRKIIVEFHNPIETANLPKSGLYDRHLQFVVNRHVQEIINTGTKRLEAERKKRFVPL